MPDVNPTDLDILRVLADGRRQNRTNLIAISDKDRDYLSTRLSTLIDKGFIRSVGPVEKSGLYEITPQGRGALRGADEPTDTDVTSTPPQSPHMSDIAFDILGFLSFSPRNTKDISVTIGLPVSMTDYILDGLAYQDCVQRTTVTVTREFADTSAVEEEEGWMLTDRGQELIDLRDDWQTGGDGAVAAKLDQSDESTS